TILACVALVALGAAGIVSAAPPADGDLIAIESMGTLQGPKFLNGITGTARVALGKDSSESGTRWRVHRLDDGTYRLECTGRNPGSRWLDARTTKRDVQLADTADGSGTRWELRELQNGTFVIRCLGDLPGPRI